MAYQPVDHSPRLVGILLCMVGVFYLIGTLIHESFFDRSITRRGCE